jgi:hypothetical protein
MRWLSLCLDERQLRNGDAEEHRVSMPQIHNLEPLLGIDHACGWGGRMMARADEATTLPTGLGVSFPSIMMKRVAAVIRTGCAAAWTVGAIKPPRAALSNTWPSASIMRIVGLLEDSIAYQYQKPQPVYSSEARSKSRRSLTA